MFRNKLSKRSESKPRRRHVQSSLRVFSYYGSSKDAAENLGRPRDSVSDTVKRLQPETGKRPWWVLLPTYFAVAALAISFVYACIIQKPAEVAVIDVAGNSIRQSDEAYKQGVKEILDKSWTSTNKITIDRQGLETSILKRFPELQDAEVRVGIGSRRPLVYLTPTQPALLLRSPSGGVFVNKQGRALANEASVSGFSDILVVNDQLTADLTLGSIVIPSQTVEFMETVQQHLSGAQMTIQYVGMQRSGRELRIRIADRPYDIKLSIDDDPRRQVGTMLVMFDYFAREGRVPAEYLDVRVPEKAFYK